MRESRLRTIDHRPCDEHDRRRRCSDHQTRRRRAEQMRAGTAAGAVLAAVIRLVMTGLHGRRLRRVGQPRLHERCVAMAGRRVLPRLHICRRDGGAGRHRVRPMRDLHAHGGLRGAYAVGDQADAQHQAQQERKDLQAPNSNANPDARCGPAVNPLHRGAQFCDPPAGRETAPQLRFEAVGDIPTGTAGRLLEARPFSTGPKAIRTGFFDLA